MNKTDVALAAIIAVVVGLIIYGCIVLIPGQHQRAVTQIVHSDPAVKHESIPIPPPPVFDQVQQYRDQAEIYLRGADSVRDQRTGLDMLRRAALEGTNDDKMNYVIASIAVERSGQELDSMWKDLTSRKYKPFVLWEIGYYIEQGDSSVFNGPISERIKVLDEMHDPHADYLRAAFDPTMGKPDRVKYLLEARNAKFYPIYYLIGRLFRDGMYGHPVDRAESIKIFREGKAAGFTACRDDLLEMGAGL